MPSDQTTKVRQVFKRNSSSSSLLSTCRRRRRRHHHHRHHHHLCGLELCGLSSYVGMAGNPSRTVIPTYETNPKFCEETPSYILHCKSRDVIGRKCLASRASQALMRAYGFVVRATSHEPGAEHHVLHCIVLDSLAQVCSTTRTSPRPLRRWSSALVHFRCRRWTLVIGRCGASNTKLTSSAFNVRHGG